MRLGGATLMLFAASFGLASAAIAPKPGVGDPHLQTVLFDPQQVVILKAAPGYALTVEFAADERIENVVIGNGVAWQVTPNKNGDRLFIKPTSSAATTNLTVITDARSYVFELQALYSVDPSLAYLVRFTYPKNSDTAVAIGDVSLRSNFTYRLSGPRALRPTEMWDDGKSTYISWGPKAEGAAVYTLDHEGHQALVNGGLRDGRFVVDQIATTFIFRLGADEGRAERKPLKKPRQ